MKYSKKYGEYPGIYQTEIDTIDGKSEGELWLEITNLEYFINGMVANAKKNKNDLTLLKTRLKEYEYSLEYLISKTKKFGVDIEKTKIRGHIIKNDSYNAWYKWWSDYFNSFTTEQAREFNILLEDGESISGYRPQGNWKENIISSKKGRK